MPKPLIYITLFLFACNSSVKYPPGGYDYPEVVADKDTNFYHYPAKDKYSRKDSFREAYEYLFFRQFDEPNLSIRPFLDPVFRLTYGGPMTLTCIITLTPKEIILKKGVANPDFDTNNYPDTNRLAPLQRWQLRILGANYPLPNRTTTSPNSSPECPAERRRMAPLLLIHMPLPPIIIRRGRLEPAPRTILPFQQQQIL
jgi:hypothetical protein